MQERYQIELSKGSCNYKGSVFQTFINFFFHVAEISETLLEILNIID